MTTDPAGAYVGSGWRTRAQEGVASRRLVAAATAATTCWIVAAALSVPDGTWLYSVMTVVPVILLVPSLVLLSLVFLRRRPIRPGLLVREGYGFFAPASWGFGLLVAGEVLMIPNLISLAYRQWRPGWLGVEGPGRMSAMPMSVFAGVLVSGAALLVIATLRRLPRLELTPAAIEVRGVLGTRAFPWEALRPALPARIDHRGLLTLVIDRPDLVVRRGATWRRRSEGRNVWRGEARLLARVIQHYVDRPDRRDEIGALAECGRLLARFGPHVRDRSTPHGGLKRRSALVDFARSQR